MSAWFEANERYLDAVLDVLRDRLVASDATTDVSASHVDAARPDVATARPGLAAMAAAMDPPPAVETLCAAFGLSAFERDLLLLCAGVELDPVIAGLCADATGDSGRPRVTFATAFGLLRERSWAAMAPSSPVRQWRLVEVGPGPALAHSPLRVDERVLLYMTGVNRPDERLRTLIEPVPVSAPDGLPSSHADLVAHATAA